MFFLFYSYFNKGKDIWFLICKFYFNNLLILLIKRFWKYSVNIIIGIYEDCNIFIKDKIWDNVNKLLDVFFIYNKNYYL